MDGDLRRQLSEALGGSSVSGDSDVVIPSSPEAIAVAMRVCATTGTHVTVSSRADAGSVAHSGIVLSLNRLQTVTLAAAQLTLRAEAGATITAVRKEAERARLAVVGLTPGVKSEHVGGLIARGEVPRRALCGIEAVLSSGERVTLGAAVLKDVVGYDLPALLLGSMGRLAIVAAVTFRLEPEGARTPVAPAPGVSEDGAHTLVARAFDPQGLLQPAG
jgi:glycolate oxidase